MTQPLLNSYKPGILGSRYTSNNIMTVYGPVSFPAVRYLVRLSHMVMGEGHVFYSQMTQAGEIVLVRTHYKIFEGATEPSTWCVVPMLTLLQAAKRGRVMRAILGSPYDTLYDRARHIFPADKDSQLRCAALCRLTLKEMRIPL